MTIGYCKRGKNCCEVCDVISENDTCSSTVETGSFKINHKFNYNDKCLLHLPTYEICNKQTKYSVRSRQNNYNFKSRKFGKNERNEVQEYLYSHFESQEHSSLLEDVLITLNDKSDGSDPKKREIFWMHTLKTLAP